MSLHEVRQGERAIFCFWLSTSVKLEVALQSKGNYESEILWFSSFFLGINFFENLRKELAPNILTSSNALK